jgi:hypothetical protein
MKNGNKTEKFLPLKKNHLYRDFNTKNVAAGEATNATIRPIL